MTRVLFASTILIAAVLLGGCATAPTAEQLAAADYGLRPGQPDAEQTGTAWVCSRLEDPERAEFLWFAVRKGWFRQGAGATRYAWVLNGTVDTGVGGEYDGAWAFYFRGNELVAVAEPGDGRHGVSALAVEDDGVDLDAGG